MSSNSNITDTMADQEPTASGDAKTFSDREVAFIVKVVHHLGGTDKALDYETISSEMGMAKSTVKNAWYAIRKKIDTIVADGGLPTGKPGQTKTGKKRKAAALTPEPSDAGDDAGEAAKNPPAKKTKGATKRVGRPKATPKTEAGAAKNAASETDVADKADSAEKVKDEVV